MPLRVCVAGVTGWTGRAVAEAVASADDLELVAGVSRSDPTSFSSVEEALDTVPVDVVVDYTHADAVKGHVLAARSARRRSRRLERVGFANPVLMLRSVFLDQSARSISALEVVWCR